MSEPIKRKNEMTEQEPVTLELPPKFKPSKACSTIKTRPIIANAHLSKTDDGYEIHATSAVVAARVPVRVVSATQEGAEGTLPIDALKRVEGQKKGRQFDVQNGSVTTDAGRVTFARGDVGKFPNLSELWPKDEPKKPFCVGLNARLLRELSQALGTDGVELQFDVAKPLGTIVVKPLDNPGFGAEGLIMPIRLNA